MDRIEMIASRAFLGEEFLTWLWWASNKRAGEFVQGGNAFRVFVEDRLALEDTGSQQAAAVAGGHSSEAPEAFEALRQGKRVASARLRLEVGERSWAFVVKGRTLDLASVQLPAVLTRVEDDRFYERMALVEELDERLDGLYGEFMAVRATPDWGAVRSDIADWAADR